MRTHKVFVVLLVVVAAAVWYLPAAAQDAGEPVRALVVDRSDKILWLGLPGPVRQGAVFDIMLVPNSKVIARATIIECTPDSPYVARAKFAMEDPSAFIPVGAYAEATNDVMAQDRDQLPGYQEVRLGSGCKNPLSLKVGAFYPDEDGLRDETDRLWPAFHLSYRLTKRGGTTVEASLGYYHGEGDFTIDDVEGSREFRVVPLTLDVKLKGSKCGGYALAGAGAYYIRDKRTLGSVEDKFTVTTFGWQAGIGYESRKGRSVELKYTDVSRSDFKGLALSLGARF